MLHMKAPAKKPNFRGKSTKIKGSITKIVFKYDHVGVRSSKLESMGIRYVFEHIFKDFCQFFIFRYFFDPERKAATKFLLPDERRDVAKMLVNFWFGVEKVSKNEKLTKIHENVFEHIPNAHALQF